MDAMGVEPLQWDVNRRLLLQGSQTVLKVVKESMQGKNCFIESGRVGVHRVRLSI